MSRPTSPAVPRPLVLSTLDELPSPPRSRTSSLPATADPFTAHPTGSGSFVTYEPNHPGMVGSSSPPPASMPLALLPKRARGSLLMAASGLAFGRTRGKGKKPSTPVQPSSFVFSEVIEISAPRKDEDDEERDRLRDAAAQSIGLDPVLLSDERSLSESEVLEDMRAGSSTPTPAPSAELPSFPSTRSALAPFVQLHARIAKHYPSPSLLKLALARQWKYRMLVLTTAAQGSACLHVFKTGVTEDRELERLPVGVDTVVFVADEDVGGRRGVVRVGRPDGAGIEMALHITDPAQAHEWITAIKQAVLSQRSVRAGLGLMSHSPGGVEPRGDMDPRDLKRARYPALPERGRHALALGRCVRTARTIFEPRQPPAVTVDASTGVDSEDSESQHEDSFGRAGTSLLGMFRSQSVASERPISPVNSMGAGGVSASVPSTPRQVDAQLAQPHAHLDRKILQDKDLDLIESKPHSGGSDVSALLRGRSPLSMATLRATPAPATTPPPLQPPPRRRGYTIGSTPMGARPRPETVAGNAYTHANRARRRASGWRAAGMGMLFAPHPPPAPSLRPGSSGEGKPRTSLSSVSSYASYASNERRASSEAGHSNGHANGNANGSVNTKRWSRQSILPHRLTPPEGALPAPPVPASTHGSPRSISSLPRHPYAAEASPQSVSSDSPQSFVFNLRETSRRDTSPLSSGSPQSFVLNLREFSRRASGSSARSTSSVSTSHSRGTTSNGSFLGHGQGHRPHSSHRASMPPPQRPAPLTALPPTPATVDPDSPPKSPNSASSYKTTFRESLALRRLSLSPPSVPPSSSLPPRPDDPPPYRSNGHRRTLSSGGPLTPIPASPGTGASDSGVASPFPPPSSPLPPTPEAHSTSFAPAQSTTPTQSQPNPQPPSRAAAFKQRIRMLSTPSQTLSLPLNIPPLSPTPSTVSPYSVPNTPIGEPIASPLLQNDPDFVNSAAMPPTPQPPPRSAFLPHVFANAVDEHEHGVTSLSPPSAARLA
ncbi:hypothetical protein EVJ58_g6028 [Rhodofomes roseus]|uniref:PH domain-containing protein n=1 Tax=Rhodofomes roseus TaxID=34475 RepID=A0A4Y9YC39_9APHY|nr:hypothetical protein EVJ58_g6028 [Rhodofomes roseus]